MDLAELYKAKGELVTKIEFAQAQLQQVNQKILEALKNADKQTVATPTEVKDSPVAE